VHSTLRDATTPYTDRYAQKEIGVKKIKELYNEKSNFTIYHFIINS